MKKIPFRELFDEVKKLSMTEGEKKSTWDGVFRRASDFPDGVSPFVNKPSNWDGTERRASDKGNDVKVDEDQNL
jgi:hypothetical protein